MDIQLLASASAPMSGSSNSILPLIILLIIAFFPISSIILSILLWKRIPYSRGLTTLFVICSLLALLMLLLISDASFLFSLGFMLFPTLLGAGSLYFLWANESTAKYFGSQIKVQGSLETMKKEYSGMPHKVRILFLLFLAPALLLIAFGLVLLPFMIATGMISQNILLVPLILFFALLNMIIPILILKRIKWGWYIAIAVSFIDLLGFPIGTVLGIVSLYLLFGNEVKGYFGK